MVVYDDNDDNDVIANRKVGVSATKTCVYVCICVYVYVYAVAGVYGIVVRFLCCLSSIDCQC